MKLLWKNRMWNLKKNKNPSLEYEIGGNLQIDNEKEIM